MVTAGNQRRARRGAERGGMKLDIAQSRLRDAIQRGGWDYATERAADTIALVVRHDEEDVGRALGGHDARRPPSLGIGGGFLDHAAEGQRWRRDLFPVNG